MTITDFIRDVTNFAVLMSCGDLEYFEVVEYPDYYAIETKEEIRKYDLITEERFF